MDINFSDGRLLLNQNFNVVAEELSSRYLPTKHAYMVNVHDVDLLWIHPIPYSMHLLLVKLSVSEVISY